MVTYYNTYQAHAAAQTHLQAANTYHAAVQQQTMNLKAQQYLNEAAAIQKEMDAEERARQNRMSQLYSLIENNAPLSLIHGYVESHPIEYITEEMNQMRPATPLENAVKQGRVDVLKLFYDKNPSAFQNQNLLFYATQPGEPTLGRGTKTNIDTLRFLLRVNPQAVRQACRHYNNPLFSAVAGRYSSLPMVQAIYDAWPGALTQRDNFTGRTLLHHAVEDQKKIHDIHDWVPSHWDGKGRCDLSIVRWILSVDPMAAQRADKQGDLPLHIVASNEGSKDMYEALVAAYPAALKTRNKKGQLPLHTYMSQMLDSKHEYGLYTLMAAYPEAWFVRDNEGKVPSDYKRKFGFVKRFGGGFDWLMRQGRSYLANREQMKIDRERYIRKLCGKGLLGGVKTNIRILRGELPSREDMNDRNHALRLFLEPGSGDY